MRFQHILALLLCFALTACAAPKPRLEPEVENAGLPTGEILDLRRLPQNLNVYAQRVDNSPLISTEEQASRMKRFVTLHFAPWDQTRSRINAKTAFSILGTGKKTSPRGYLGNKRKWSQEAWSRLVDNANRKNYPSQAQKAVVVRATSLREAPTMEPRFSSPSHPTYGYPFDMFQYAWLPVGMPLFVSHVTRDRAWYFVENALVGGWVQSKDLALVDEAVAETFKNGHYAAILRDDTPLPDSKGAPYSPQTLAGLGAVLPITDSGNGWLDVLVPVRNAQGRAVLRTSRVPSASAAPMPMPMTAEAVARLAEPLLGDAYGWGGMNGGRDCSSTLRDVFMPFGIWLPRNSASQAKSWDLVSLSGLTPEEKLARIKAEGRPFATLLWLPGHITLYIGQYHNEAAMFHNMWGIRVKEPGREGAGRFVIGRAVVTSTRPGAELPNLAKADPLLSSMRGMSILR